MKKFRICLIRFLINLNESVIFYPKLKRVYTKYFKQKTALNIIDVGVNRGQSIDFFHKLKIPFRVIGYEPNPTLYQKLLIKYANDKTVTIKNIACSEKEGELIFYESIIDETSSLEKPNLDAAYLKKKAKVLGVQPNGLIKKEYLVKTVCLAKELEKMAPIDLLKIDIEGHELSCLKGLFNHPAYSNKINLIQIESRTNNMYHNQSINQSINQLFHTHGFELYKSIPHGFGDLVELIYINKNFNQ